MQIPNGQSSPLAFAAFVGNEEAVKICIRSGRWDLICLDQSLLYAAMFGHTKVVDILQAGRSFPHQVVERAFRCALLQNHLGVCTHLTKATSHKINLNMDDLDQLIMLDRAEALKLCCELTDMQGKLFCFRLFQLACLCVSTNVLEWFITNLENGVFPPSPALLHAVLRVQQLHVYVPRLLRVRNMTVSYKVWLYCQEPSFTKHHPQCARLVFDWVVKRRWRQVRGVFWFVVFCQRWVRDHYKPGENGYQKTKEIWSQRLEENVGQRNRVQTCEYNRESALHSDYGNPP